MGGGGGGGREERCERREGVGAGGLLFVIDPKTPATHNTCVEDSRGNTLDDQGPVSLRPATVK